MSYSTRPATALEERPPALSGNAVVLLQRLTATVALITLVSLLILIITSRFTPRNFGFVTEFVIVVLCYREFRAGRINRGLIIFSWGIWLSACLFSFIVAGIRTPFLYGLPVVLMTTAWVQGRRAAWLMTLGSIIGYVAVAAAELLGWLPPPMPRTAIDLVIIYSLVALMAAALAVSLAEAFQNLYAGEQALSEELQQSLDELQNTEAALREANETLESRVEERTEEYERANRALQDTVNQLEYARAELLQAEKLSALGSMVAGISHELNTPLGNARLSTSTLQEQFKEFDRHYREGSLSRSRIEAFLDESKFGIELAARAVERAGALVDNFKQVAIDQTSERRRHFDLATVVEETVATLRPRYKHEPWKIVVAVDPDLLLDSYPGPLEQILLNLVMNSIRHGFEGREHGSVTICGRLDAQASPEAAQPLQVVLTVADDGIGIPAQHLSRVFDPFFTTKLGQGGSGIGLNIAHRIATTLLGGSIAVSSTPNIGTTFTITIPLQAPHSI